MADALVLRGDRQVLPKGEPVKRWKQCSVVAIDTRRDRRGPYVVAWRLRCGAVVPAQRRVEYRQPPAPSSAPHRRKRWLWLRGITGTTTKPCPNCGGGESRSKQETRRDESQLRQELRRAVNHPVRLEALAAVINLAALLCTFPPRTVEHEKCIEDLARQRAIAGIGQAQEEEDS